MKKIIGLLVLTNLLFSCKENSNKISSSFPESQINSIKEIDSLEELGSSNEILFNEYFEKVSKNQYKRTCLNWSGVIKNIDFQEYESSIELTGEIEFEEYFYYSFKYYLNKNAKETDIFYNKIKKISNGDKIYLSGVLDSPSESDLILNKTSLSLGSFTIYPFDIDKEKIIYSKDLIGMFEFQNQIWFNMKYNSKKIQEKDIKEAKSLADKLHKSEKQKMESFTGALSSRFQLGTQ